jgi:hypothetical protein
MRESNSHTATDIFSRDRLQMQKPFWIVLYVIYVFYGLETPTLWKSFKNGLASVQRGKHIFHILYCVGERFLYSIGGRKGTVLLGYCLEGFLERSKPGTDV